MGEAVPPRMRGARRSGGGFPGTRPPALPVTEKFTAEAKNQSSEG